MGKGKEWASLHDRDLGRQVGRCEEQGRERDTLTSQDVCVRVVCGVMSIHPSVFRDVRDSSL